MIVDSRYEKLVLKIKPWGDDTPLPILYKDGFINTYPYNYKNSFSDSLQEREFDSMVLENDYLKATIIPELGARLFSLFDKVARREVFNMPEAICPSPIYLRGAFFPIGVEFNFPQGHSVHTADYVPCEFEGNSDRKSIVMHTFNAVARIATDIRISLAPGERKISVELKFKNTLPVRNGMMYWGNAAVEQTPELTFQCKAPMCHFFDSYQSFPYINGEDNRIAKNRHFASDLFCIGSKEDWFGFYSHEKGHGCAHISPIEQMVGKKFFSWGFDDYAFRWGRHYGCSEYGYVEIQSGILETQFEHFYLEPFEEKNVEETWFPYSGTGNISLADYNFVVSASGGVVHITPSKSFTGLQVNIKCKGSGKTTVIDYIEPGSNVNIDVPADFDSESYDIQITDADDRSVLVDKQVRPPVQATQNDITAKKEWLELKATDCTSKLERAQRFYKGRMFSEASRLLKSIDSSNLRGEVSRMESEIAYLKDNLPDIIGLASEMGADCVVSFASQISKDCDYYAAVAETDALYSCGMIKEAIQILMEIVANGKANSSIYYTLGYLVGSYNEDGNASKEYFEIASEYALENVNPYTKLERIALGYAVEQNPYDASALYLLGNYWSRWDENKASDLWRRAIVHDPKSYLALRNLAYVSMRKRNDIVEAVDLYKMALDARSDCPDLIVEYICALRLQGDIDEALLYIKNLDPVLSCDYRMIKTKILLLRDCYRFQDAVNIILSAENLYIWEGEHDLHRCYVECLMALGNKALEVGNLEQALEHFRAMLDHPESLCQGKSYDENESAAYYHMGMVYEAAGNSDRANDCFQMAVDQPFPNVHHAVSYRENEYYAALAARKIGDLSLVDMIIGRLLERYNFDYSACGEEITPLGGVYWRHLAAARGCILAGRMSEAAKALDNLRNAYGKCWPLQDALVVLNASVPQYNKIG